METITGTLTDITGAPVVPTRATIVGDLAATGTTVQLPVPAPVAVTDTGELTITAPQGRATLTLELPTGNLDLPLVISAGVNLADAIHLGGQVETIPAARLVDMVERMERAHTDIRNMLDEAERTATHTRTTVEDAAREAITAAKDEALADIQVATEYAHTYREECRQAANAVEQGVQQATQATNSLTAQLTGAQGLLDTMESYLDVVKTTASGALSKLQDAQGVSVEVDARLDAVEEFTRDNVQNIKDQHSALEGRVLVLETAVFDDGEDA